MSSCGAQADDLVWPAGRAGGGEIRQHVDRVGDDQDDGVLLQPGRLDLAEDVQEELDVAVDQVEAALVGLAAQAGGDHDRRRSRGSPRSPSARMR